VTPVSLLAMFEQAAVAVRDAVKPVLGQARRARTDVPGQYAIDLVADRAALEVLHGYPVAVLSEETARTGDPGSTITVVIDPIDGSTNCARGIPYWATSIAALDADGLWCAYVVNHATGMVTTAVRGEGAWRDGERLEVSTIERSAESVLILDGFPRRPVRWKQYRALGSQALGLCDVAAGAVEAYVGIGHTAPWDYTAGMLIVAEAGGVVWSPSPHDLLDLTTTDRRQVVAACTPQLLDELRPMVG
jgi:fructose-1,6-bisphosphatase/inositol monophosphatase family enzyme